MSVDAKSQLAVALHYDKSGAPRVVAKGKGTIGAKIIEIAKAHDIPIEENEVLAGALSNVELGDEIPVELYRPSRKSWYSCFGFLGRIRLERDTLRPRSPSCPACPGHPRLPWGGAKNVDGRDKPGHDERKTPPFFYHDATVIWPPPSNLTRCLP